MKNNYQFSLGDLTFTIRKINSLTQVEFSKRLGVVQSTVSKVEKDIFEDVPFSLVSKISMEFNIPISYFQLGLLPLRKTNNLYKTIPKAFIENGPFRAKTIFYILEWLAANKQKTIYKDLKLSRQFLCLSNLNYSFDFVNKVYSLAQQDLIMAITETSEQLDSNQEVSLDSLFHHLSTVHEIVLNSDLTEVKSNNGLVISFDSEIHELDKIYAELLKLELQIHFNCKFAISEKSSGEFEIKVLATT